MQTIELDCPPGGIRPGNLIDDVLAGTNLTPVGEPSTFFGNWTWEFDVPRDQWVRDVQPIVKPRITALYHAGVIRYGSW